MVTLFKMFMLQMKLLTVIASLMLVSMAMARWTPLGEKFNRLYEYDYADEDEDSGYAGGLLQEEDENAYADKNEEPGYADELYEDEDAYADREDQVWFGKSLFGLSV